MIKTYLKHQIIDKFINTLFDGLINTFNTKEAYKFNTGDKFARIDVLFKDKDNYRRVFLYSCEITDIIDDVLHIKSNASTLIYGLIHHYGTTRTNSNEEQNVMIPIKCIVFVRDVHGYGTHI